VHPELDIQSGKHWPKYSKVISKEKQQHVSQMMNYTNRHRGCSGLRCHELLDPHCVQHWEKGYWSLTFSQEQ